MTLLTVSNLQKNFGGVNAVDDVSFTVKAGELLALIGPNGAGKSTTFNCINGQHSANGGSVKLNGREMLGRLPHRIWKMGVGRTFQITATFVSMSVIENVQVVLMNRHRILRNVWKRARTQYKMEAAQLLALVGLENHAELATSTLAYGDLKRLELAMALAHDPKLLLMDEPTAGMGGQEREGLMETTRRIAKDRNIGVLFTEHDMDAVFRHADRIIVLHRGALIAEGTSDEIRGNPKVREVYLGKE